MMNKRFQLLLLFMVGGTQPETESFHPAAEAEITQLVDSRVRVCLQHLYVHSVEVTNVSSEAVE